MRAWGWMGGLCACLMAAGGAQATTTIDGVGDSLPQATYTQEFSEFSSVTPSVLFSYQLSTTAASIFLSDTSLQYGADEIPLSSTQALGYTRSATNGPLIQIPMFGFAVAIPYTNAGLGRRQQLTDTSLCAIMSGAVTDWKQISKTSGPIAVMYRADADPTTYVLSQHFHAVCNAGNSAFGSYPVPITSQFSTMFANGKVPAGFTAVSGAQNMANALLATPLSMGYLTPDYTSAEPHSPHATVLKVAGLVNAVNNISYAPNASTTNLGLANPGLGSTNTSPPSTKTAAINVLNWVPSVPVTNKGYPIVGYADWLLVTCNGSTAIDQDMGSFLVDHYKNPTYKTIRTNSGFVNIPAAYYSAIHAVFLSNQRQYGLNIGNSTTCPHG